jgi:predicted transcriptional regulator
MRVHLLVDDDLIDRIDRIAGERGRSGWIVKVIKEAVDVEERWDAIEAAIGSIPDTGHDWDDDPVAWVRAQRRADPDAVG